MGIAFNFILNSLSNINNLLMISKHDFAIHDYVRLSKKSLTFEDLIHCLFSIFPVGYNIMHHPAQIKIIVECQRRLA